MHYLFPRINNFWRESDARLGRTTTFRHVSSCLQILNILSTIPENLSLFICCILYIKGVKRELFVFNCAVTCSLFSHSLRHKHEKSDDLLKVTPYIKTRISISRLIKDINLTFRGQCIMIYPYNKTKEVHWFPKFIFGIEFYTFRTVSLSIIRSLALYTQQ
jgi:hypothetical protein